jgi:hypothetical protein
MALKANRISPSSGEYIMEDGERKKKVTMTKKNLLVVSRCIGQVIYSFYYLIKLFTSMVAYFVLWRSIVATLEHLTVDRITVEAEKLG